VDFGTIQSIDIMRNYLNYKQGIQKRTQNAIDFDRGQAGYHQEMDDALAKLLDGSPKFSGMCHTLPIYILYTHFIQQIKRIL